MSRHFTSPSSSPQPIGGFHHDGTFNPRNCRCPLLEMLWTYAVPHDKFQRRLAGIVLEQDDGELVYLERNPSNHDAIYIVETEQGPITHAHAQSLLQSLILKAKETGQDPTLGQEDLTAPEDPVYRAPSFGYGQVDKEDE